MNKKYKYIGYILFFCAFIALIIWNINSIKPFGIFAQQSNGNKVPEIKKVTKKENKIGIPKILIIPSINVSTTIESVGVDGQGRMGIPGNFDTVGWYYYGAKPGESGNAVIDGHYDNEDGSPAIFYYLSSLKPGDEVIVVDNNNKQYTFMVYETRKYDYDSAPIEDIFGTFNKPRLILITCAGSYDLSSDNYSQRTIVYSYLLL